MYCVLSCSCELSTCDPEYLRLPFRHGVCAALSSQRRRGVSPVIAAVILTGILMVTISIAVYYSTSLIDMNRQVMEYEYAKEQLAYAATALEQVAFGAGGARYIRFSLTSTGLNFEHHPDVLEVTITGGGSQPVTLTLRPARVAVCGGPLVATVPRLLYPEGGSLDELGKLVVGAGEPIVLVHERHAGRACAYLETYRVRAVYSGVTYAGSEERVPYNYYTVHIINATLGRLGGSGTIPLVLRNLGTFVYQYSFGSPSVTVYARLGGYQSELTLTGSPGAQGSVVIIKVSQVEVGTG